MDRGAWRATARGAAQSRARRSACAHTVVKLHDERVIHFCQDISLHLRPDSVPNCKTGKNEGFQRHESGSGESKHKTLDIDNFPHFFFFFGHKLLKQIQKFKEQAEWALLKPPPGFNNCSHLHTFSLALSSPHIHTF